MEDYLEQISGLIAEKGYARVVDIAERLSVSQASVTNMIKRLDGEGLVNYERYRGTTLTERGQEVADYIIRRHDILTRLLQLFDIDDATIYDDVEGMEHHVSSPTMRVFEALVSELEASPEAVTRIRTKLKSQD
ncbi:transcriptional regulator MntR [Roseibacillus ishigakijimensis]|uniref:Transcriptional regulator MntR n=2 Tax=Roseibacillus ishigakijimensis TaxID=454146 RepID=A0A934RTN2_9BACT|nr:transcriptional regulator MntR [Roseibacillus ishigakijimensis]